MLRQARTEVGIVKALSAHFVYWTNPETAQWILYAIYGTVGQSPQKEPEKPKDKEKKKDKKEK